MAGTFTTKHANGIVANAKAAILTAGASESLIIKKIKFFNAGTVTRTLRVYTNDGSSLQGEEIPIPAKKCFTVDYEHLQATHTVEADDSGGGGTDINWRASYFVET